MSAAFTASASADRNFAILRECLSTPVLRKSAPSGASDGPTAADAAELADFIDYLATELFSALPRSFREASYATRASLDLDPPPTAFPLPPDALDSLVNYSLVPDHDDAERLLRDAVADYVDASTAPPPVWAHTKATECEICERQVPLSYHHLVPRETHRKALKRGWHPKEMLNSVAWLCRPCHSTVHRYATNEELAQKYHTVELLLQREDIQKWAAYVSRQRWGGRGAKNR